MTFGGSGDNPTSIPRRQHSEPPRRVPDQPPGGGRLIREKIVKWGAIALVVLFLVLFVYMVIDSVGNESENGMTDGQIATLEARRG